MNEFIANFDEVWFRRINELVQDPLWAKIFFILALYGIAVYILILFYYWYNPRNKKNQLYHKRAMVMASLAVLLTIIFENVFDLVVARPRPYLVFDNVISFDVLVDTASFPSLHVAVAFAFAVMLLLLKYKKAGICALLLALAIGLSRIASGVHYPTDIIGGIVLGSLSAYLVFSEADWLRQYLPKKDLKK